MEIKMIPSKSQSYQNNFSRIRDHSCKRPIIRIPKTLNTS